MSASVRAAAAAVRRGGVVCYPTDTLMGLAVRPDDPRALERLFRVKRRPEGAPVSLALSSWEEAEAYAELSELARRTLRSLLPGAYTLLVRPTPFAREHLAPALVGPTGLLGLRLPDHPVARELARRAGPVTSTSANLHGAPPVRDEREARRTFGRAVAAYLPASPRPSGVPSQLIDLSGARPRLVPRR